MENRLEVIIWSTCTSCFSLIVIPSGLKKLRGRGNSLTTVWFLHESGRRDEVFNGNRTYIIYIYSIYIFFLYIYAISTPAVHLNVTVSDYRVSSLTDATWRVSAKTSSENQLSPRARSNSSLMSCTHDHVNTAHSSLFYLIFIRKILTSFNRGGIVLNRISTGVRNEDALFLKYKKYKSKNDLCRWYIYISIYIYICMFHQNINSCVF